MYSGQIKCLIQILFKCILYQLLFLLSMRQYRYLCRIFERKCSFDDVFSLFEVDQVNAKYVSRATQPRFFVNHVTHTNQLAKIVSTSKVWTMTELNMYPTRSFMRIKATYTNRIPSDGVSYAPFRHFFAQKIHCIWSGSYSVSMIRKYHNHSVNP